MQGVENKIILPINADKEIEMQNNGYFFADRTLGVSINLAKCDFDYKKLIRMEIIESNSYKNEILDLAIRSFPYDRRFHIKPEIDIEIAKIELKKWVDELDSTLVCIYKDTLIGFLNLKEIDSDTLFIHLAAVDEKYRLTGVAMSLYLTAIKIAKEKGYKKLDGRISSQNMAVMNLYAFLGATFLNPEDIFLKEE